MALELPEGLQKHVFDTIAGALKSREVLEAERPAHVPPYTDDRRVLLQNWTTLVDRQGRLLAQLSVVPATIGRADRANAGSGWSLSGMA
jgi:hypothetical protein